MADDYSNNTLTAGRVSSGGSVRGSIETSADTDWFRTTLSAGIRYTFDLEGSATSAGTLRDPFLRLRDASGNSIIYDDDAGTGLNARIQYTPQTSGYYFLAVGPSDGGTGTYRLSVTGITPPANRAPVATATDKTLVPGQSVPLSDLFRYSDPDGDAITQFAVRDRDIGGAYLTRDGVRMTDGQTYDPKPISEIGLWKVVGAGGAAVDHIGFNAYDSKGAYSPAVAATVTTTAPANRAPVAMATDKTLVPGQSVPLSDLFRYSDPDGDAITQFAVRDRDIGGAYLTRDGVRMTDGQTYDPKPISEIGLWKVVGAGGAAVDHIGFNAYDSKGAYSPAVAATVTTTAPADTTAPSLSSTSPADNATGVAVGANVVLTFNEAVKAGAGNIEIRKVADGSLFKSIAVTDTSQVTFSGNAATINPNSDLAADTDYYVKVPSGAIKDSAGNSYAGISSSTAFNFKTALAADTTAPSLSSTSPADNATGVAVGANVVLTFNEAVKAGSGNIEIRKSADGSLFKSIAVTDASQVKFSGNAATMNPSSDLAANTDYYVKVASGAIKDLAGNSYAGISSSTELNFKTASVLPATLSIAPLSADSANKLEGNSGPTPFTFTVTRTGNTTVATTADWAVSANQSPDANGTDFVGGSFPRGQVNFAANETAAKTVTINVAGDTVYESAGLSESFVVTLSNPSSGTVIDALRGWANGYIRNDDAVAVPVTDERWDEIPQISNVLGTDPDGGFADKLPSDVQPIFDDLFSAVLGGSGKLTSGYVADLNYYNDVIGDTGKNVYHAGLDISKGSIVGKSVNAATGGTVTNVVNNKGDYNYMVIKDLENNYWLYGHVTGVVSVNASVQTGQKIATVSNLSTLGDHLHLGVFTTDPSVLSYWGRNESNSTITRDTMNPLQAYYLLKDNTLIGTNDPERIAGLQGKDTISSGGGNDMLLGGTGNDSLSAGDGDDSIEGGSGADTIYGGSGNDKIWGHIVAGPNAADGADRIYCEAGNDYAIGHNGDDLVDGGSGNDDVYGDLGNDTLIGGLGQDTMGGGAGNDIFRFNSAAESAVGSSRDIVYFKLPGAALEDRIDLSAVYSGTLAWKGTGALVGASVRVLNGANNQTIVQVSNDADSAVEMEIALADDTYTAANYVAADFIL